MHFKNYHLKAPKLLLLVVLVSTSLCADDSPFVIGGTEELISRSACHDLGLEWFVDGNIGVATIDGEFFAYAANGASPVRFQSSMDQFIQGVSPVRIVSDRSDFHYLAGGPVLRDPTSGKLLLFYHAEIHRGTERNFYSSLGIAVQTDAQGLEFADLGEIFIPETAQSGAAATIEVCGAPYVIKGQYIYVYTRDRVGHREKNLVVVRASLEDVFSSARNRKAAVWMKYFEGNFSEPACGGRSSSLEKNNPNTRWMDVTYNRRLGEFVMVVAASDKQGTGLYLTRSVDGIHWSPRWRIPTEVGESFYPSIVDYDDSPRETDDALFIIYTHSKKGEWDRWQDAKIMRRKIGIESFPTDSGQ